MMSFEAIIQDTVLRSEMRILGFGRDAQFSLPARPSPSHMHVFLEDGFQEPTSGRWSRIRDLDLTHPLCERLYLQVNIELLHHEIMDILCFSDHPFAY
jgi:hypothetical protein